MDPWEKSQTVDPEVRAYVYSLVNAVGGSSTIDGTYAVGDDAIAVLKDLARWLKLYDEKTGRMDVKRCLADANLVKGDLLEILALWTDDNAHQKSKSRIALACLELLVPLTWPLELDIERATVNHHRHVPYLQLAQVGYKRAVLQHEFAKILRTVVRIVLPAMAQPRRERSRRDEGIIKLGLYFFRNMAMITQPQTLPSQGDENDVSRSATISAFSEQDVFTLLLTIGSGMSDEFKEQDVLVLEILFHVLKGVDARKLFMRREQVARSDADELKSLISREKAMLSSYSKHAPTRHNRFGTMIWVKRDELRMSTVSGQTSITDETSTLQQMDASKKFNKPQNRGRKAQDVSEQSDIGSKTELTETARSHLKSFVEDFMDSSFNPLFSSLRKAIESESDRVQETIHNKQYFYLISWFLTAEAARREQQTVTATGTLRGAEAPVSEDNSFTYIAAVLDQETFVLINRKMQAALDHKEWQDLQAILMSFTQILLTVQKMAESKDEEDQEIAENIQNRIFYEEATHDRMVQILRNYTHQGMAYLDAVTESVHVFVRMLEQYSKQNVDLQIRSKRRARKKAKEQTTGANAGGEEEAEERLQDEQESHQALSERKFDFARFSTKFLSQPCVNTFVALMHLHHDLTPAQLKRCHRYLYRLAFKHDLAIMLFRVDILQLLHRMIKGPGGLDSSLPTFKEWEQLIQQIFRRCFKWLERTTEGSMSWKEAAVVEMLFSKNPGTIYYLQNGHDRVVEKRPPRPPAELEIKASVPANQRIAVAASIMLEHAKAGDLAWIKRSLTGAAEERKAWEDLHNVREENADSEGGAAVRPDPPSIFLVPDDTERKEALFKDKHLRLMLETLGIQRIGMTEDIEASWVIPAAFSSEQLMELVDQIQKVEFEPPVFDAEKSASDLIRSKSAKRRGATFSDSSEDEDGGGGDIDDAMFPANLKEKRQKKSDNSERPRKRRRKDAVELTEEELRDRAKARQKKEKEKNAKIKSKLFVTESDDESDDERDAEFFRLEEERRKKTAGLIHSALLKEVDADEYDGSDSSAKRRRDSSKSKARPRQKEKRPSDDRVMNDSGDEVVDTHAIDISEDDESEAADDTPISSPAAPAARSPPLKEVSGNATNTKWAGINEDEEEDLPIMSKRMTAGRRRTGFVIDDDSDDE